jgi:uncharacterized protein involved in type VI secretion and phage assembly
MARYFFHVPGVHEDPRFPSGKGKESQKTLHVSSFTFTETISSLYSCTLEVVEYLPKVDSKPQVDEDELEKKPAALAIHPKREKDGEPRLVIGIIDTVQIRGVAPGEHAVYSIVIKSPLQQLATTSGRCTYEKTTRKKIAEDILSDVEHLKVTWELSQTLEEEPYLPQTDQSDLAYITNLLAEKDIYPIPVHHEDHLELIWTDAESRPTISGDPNLPYYQPEGDEDLDKEYVTGFTQTKQRQPSKVENRSYDWFTDALSGPMSLLDDLLSMVGLGGLVGGGGGKAAKPEVRPYDSKIDAGQMSARINQQRSPGSGESNSIRFKPGFTFNLGSEDYPHQNTKLNGKGLLVNAVTHRGRQPLPHFGSGRPATYSNSIKTQPDDVPFKPALQPPPKPALQTAVVVDKDGKTEGVTPYTNDEGCIRVRFHWDKKGDSENPLGDDDKGPPSGGSCWCRYAVPFGGPDVGFSFLPLPGFEVLVAFPEGNDRVPIAIACLHSTENANKQPRRKIISSGPKTLGIGEKKYPGDWEDPIGPKSQTYKNAKSRNVLGMHTHDKGQKHHHALIFECDPSAACMAIQTTADSHYVTNGIMRVRCGARATTINENCIEWVNANKTIHVEDHFALSAKTIEIHAEQELTLRIGKKSTISMSGSQVDIKTDGNVKVNGQQVSVDGSTCVKINCD